MSALLALFAGVAGALLVYLSSPRQNWRALAVAGTMRLAGAVLCVLSLLAWCRSAGTAAGIAASLTTLMLAWVAAPYLGWWWLSRRRRFGR